MEEPRWLSCDLVLKLHQRSIERFGGSHGVRDEGLMLSAVARPENAWAYGEETDLFELAGSYAFGIVRNHPFVDGNKRTAVAAAVTFLGLNGQMFVGEQVEVVLATVSLASGEWDEATYAFWLKENCSPI